jgi:CRP/FNR family cyclic AMP-dependent transcriptional regulator
VLPLGARFGSPCFADTKESDAAVPVTSAVLPGAPALMAAVDAHIALLDADGGFAAGIPSADLALARRVLVLPRLDVDPGAWTPPPADDHGGALALLVDGLVGRHIGLGGRVATQLLGPGDVFDPWTRPGDELLPRAVRWSGFTPATVVLLDGRFATAAQRWPALSRTAQTRLSALGDRVAIDLAICQLPRVEQRVLALLWHLAERFGRVASDGVVLDIKLTHRLIGELVGAQRPTVSLAVASLFDEGQLVRRASGTLVLDRESRSALAPSEVPAPLVARAAEPAVARTELLERVPVLQSEAA